jgi:hypothetical protein
VKRVVQTFHYLPNNTDTLPTGWVAINQWHVPDVKERRKLHGKWVKLKSNLGTTYRSLRFDPYLRKDQILLDWQGQIKLHGHQKDAKRPQRLTISKLPSWMVMFASHQHPDPSVNASSWGTTIGLLLAVYGLLRSTLLPLIDRAMH